MNVPTSPISHAAPSTTKPTMARSAAVAPPSTTNPAPPPTTVATPSHTVPATHGIEAQDPPSLVVSSAAWTSDGAGWGVSTSAKTEEDPLATTTRPSRITMKVRFIASPLRPGSPR